MLLTRYMNKSQSDKHKNGTFEERLKWILKETSIAVKNIVVNVSKFTTTPIVANDLSIAKGLSVANQDSSIVIRKMRENVIQRRREKIPKAIFSKQRAGGIPKNVLPPWVHPQMWDTSMSSYTGGHMDYTPYVEKGKLFGPTLST